jgi:hypothetical protein
VAVFRGASIQRQNYSTTDKHGLTWSSTAATKQKKRTHAEAQRRREKTRIDSEVYGLISLRLCASAPLREKTREIHEVFPNVQELEIKSLVATPT